MARLMNHHPDGYTLTLINLLLWELYREKDRCPNTDRTPS
jgi:hypothetical protein